MIAVSVSDLTAPSVEAARPVLEAAGYGVAVFPATGSGGRTMEGLVRGGRVAGVLDLTTGELADQLAGGPAAAGPDRLTAAAIRGVPQVISLGGLDAVSFGPAGMVPERYHGRRFHASGPNIRWMRTTPEEMDRLGQEIAHKAAAAAGPTRVLVPLRGLSALDADGQPFWWPEADAALFQSLRNWIYPPPLLVELDHHINDPAFAAAAANELLRLIGADGS